jgi:hypothetical protein
MTNWSGVGAGSVIMFSALVIAGPRRRDNQPCQSARTPDLTHLFNRLRNKKRMTP